MSKKNKPPYAAIDLVELENEYIKLSGVDRLVYRPKQNEFNRWIEIDSDESILIKLQTSLLHNYNVLSFIHSRYESIESDNIIYTMHIYSYKGDIV